MPLEVIGAGFGRTGTLSLKLALERLGFAPCYHMTEVLAHPEHVPAWDAAARGQPVDWDDLFRGYRATVDWPACNFYRELLDRYPDAKVILTVRDPGRWYDSARQTIYQVGRVVPPWLLPLMPRMRRFQRMTERLIWEGTFGGRFEDRDHALAVFHRHSEAVRRAVPPERLLVYEVSEGWGPLCAFLGVPEPAGEPFPRVNDAAEFRARILRGARIMRAASYAAVGVAGLILAWLAYRMLS